jgi:hypothetical protein
MKPHKSFRGAAVSRKYEAYALALNGGKNENNGKTRDIKRPQDFNC